MSVYRAVRALILRKSERESLLLSDLEDQIIIVAAFTSIELVNEEL